MLRLQDARTNSLAELQTRRHRVVRLWVHVEAAPSDSATALRALLVADVITRMADLRGMHVISAATLPGRPGAHDGAVKADSARLNIHPPGAFTTAREAEAHLDGPADLHIADRDADADEIATDPGALWIRVGSAQPSSGFSASSEAEPLAVRLALLSVRYQDPVTLAGRTLTDAGAVIRRWRDRVAVWASSPSRAPHHDTVQRCEDALDDNLDTARALAALHTLETDPEVPDGAKFETFVYLDRILGLDVAQDIGRPRA